jgi:hypothetical protein
MTLVLLILDLQVIVPLWIRKKSVSDSS